MKWRVNMEQMGKRTEALDKEVMEADKRTDELDKQNMETDKIAEETVKSRRKTRRTKEKKRLTGSLTARIAAFILLAITCLTGLSSVFFCGYMVEEGYYTAYLNEVLSQELYDACKEVAYTVRQFLQATDREGAEAYCESRNVTVELIETRKNGKQGQILWSTKSNFETEISLQFFLGFETTVILGGNVLDNKTPFSFRVYVDPNFPKYDNFRQIGQLVTTMYENKYKLVGIASGSVFLAIICILFLICSAGHRNGCGDVVHGILTKIPLDVVTAFFGGVMFCFPAAIYWSLDLDWDIYTLVLIAVAGTLEVIWITIYIYDLAIRLKLGKWWRNTLIYMILRGIWRLLRFVCKGLATLLKGVPTVITTVSLFLGIRIAEILIMIMVGFGGDEILVLWLIENLVLLPAVVYLAITCKRLLKASQALAEGQENYRVDTSNMFGEFKEHGENLNSLGKGITRAVEERMRSERMKTELITNVSHDIKTPLTSIINYADLICEEAGSDNEKIAEYAEVLLRQSRRMKKLLEDLVDASKAATGNLEVNLAPCEVGVLLSQAMGEYQKRMEEKELELIVRQPQESVRIQADGRHLWRVFDNLLNNICKYAQEKTRVYLSVEQKEDQVFIVFRNMSKYALDISPEELEERFVRGDKSRHMEGNGLGLSIAKSLMDLQNGRMEIVTDGDLFKVTLRFDRLLEEVSFEGAIK